jgi:hypothetical protein
MPKKVKLSKIPVLPLLELLKTLYEKGTDFIDIIGSTGENGESDVIGIAVLESYIEVWEEPEEKRDGPLNEDIIKKLIG